MTPEQRAHLEQHFKNLIACDEADGVHDEIPAFQAALELISDESELHRAIGAAVLPEVNKHGGISSVELDQAARAIARTGRSRSAAVLRAIARVLHEVVR